MKRLLITVATCTAVLVVTGAAASCPEDSICDVDLLFSDTAGHPALCPTFDYIVHDKNSGRVLLAKTTESAPGSKPCPRTCASGTKLGTYCLVDADCPPATAGICALQAGCATVRLPPAAGPYVGRCTAPNKDRSCTQNSHCAPGTCTRDAAEVSQVHMLSGVCQPGTADQYTFWVEVPVINGQFVPLP